MLIDNHCHLFLEYYSDLKVILNNALEKKVNLYINNGTNRDSNEEVLTTSNDYENVYGAIGIHPEEADNFVEADLDFIKNNLNNPKIVAIGEIGLDYHYSKDSKEKQIVLLEQQLKMAEEYNLPVIIHSRDATKDMIDILKKYKLKGIIHCFSGSYETAQIYLKMGFKLGINGVVTFKNSKLKEVLQRLDLKDIVLETDSPYLSPEPFRGKPNEPCNIYNIALFLTEIFGVSIEELAEVTSQNSREIFDKLPRA